MFPSFLYSALNRFLQPQEVNDYLFRSQVSSCVQNRFFHDFTYAWTWDPLDIILLRALIPERKRPNPELFLSYRTEWKCWKKIAFVKKSIFQVLHLWFLRRHLWFLRRHLWFLKTENLREDLFQFYLFGMTFFKFEQFFYLNFFFWDSPRCSQRCTHATCDCMIFSWFPIKFLLLKKFLKIWSRPPWPMTSW